MKVLAVVVLLLGVDEDVGEEYGKRGIRGQAMGWAQKWPLSGVV